MIKDRIKEVRKNEKLSQPVFGERLGVTRDVISNIELGRVEPKEVFIKLLCKEFNINKEWLRTGKGEMFTQVNDDEKMMKLMDELTKSEDKDAQDLFVALYSLKGEYFEIAKDIIFSLEKRSSKK